MKKNPAPPATAAKAPTAAEIDEFFSVAEEKEQKRFSDKYNFDIVNDVPMDGSLNGLMLIDVLFRTNGFVEVSKF
ncbi:hypothetical protein L1987_14851 [Smallanthus sonchifolius]|uniref:Uncharacterized protein n=1 Tax=Smallanthus sonchifolius TaxID=185202 RepID=A0ACB9J664_9ASTR|nr:hypothetical protein L1987_14851 [Smallanthus sonchifolius]